MEEEDTGRPQHWVWWAKGGGGVLAGYSPVDKGDALALITFTFPSSYLKIEHIFF